MTPVWFILAWSRAFIWAMVDLLTMTRSRDDGFGPFLGSLTTHLANTVSTPSASSLCSLYCWFNRIKKTVRRCQRGPTKAGKWWFGMLSQVSSAPEDGSAVPDCFCQCPLGIRTLLNFENKPIGRIARIHNSRGLGSDILSFCKSEAYSLTSQQK